jgi:hypothetical protein
MTTFSTLPLGCPKCGTRFTVTLAGWDPDHHVKSRYLCPSCHRIQWMTLPGRIVWVGDPISVEEAANKLAVMEAVERVSTNVFVGNFNRVGEGHRDAKTVAGKVREWQSNPMVHPLTCGNDSGHRKLVPVEAGGGVFLVCLDCDYPQDWIPEIVTGPLV